MEDDSDSQSVLEALVPGEEGAVGDGKRWKGEAEGDLTPGEEGAVGDGEPWKGKAKGDLPIREESKSSSPRPMSRSSRLSSSNIGTLSETSICPVAKLLAVCTRSRKQRQNLAPGLKNLSILTGEGDRG